MGLLTKIFKHERPPAEALAGLDPHERVTGWGTMVGGDVLVATPQGLWLSRPDGRARLAWHEIHKATWAEGTLVIVPGTEVEPGVVADISPILVELEDPRDLPAEVRTRVTRSVAYSSHHQLGEAGGVQVVARRIAGEDGLTWVLRFDEGTDRADPAVREQASELLDQARALTDVPQ
jgi:hypothetical protein